MVDRGKIGARYAPEFRSEHDDLVRYLDAELNRISITIGLLADGHLEPVYEAPARPRDGDIRYADGTEWNPGSGEGFYGYVNGSWVFFG